MKKAAITTITGIFAFCLFTSSASAEEIIVEKGDNLWNLAKEYNSTVDTLVDVNNLQSSLIYPDQVLYTTKHYTVQKGDTLGDIAKLYNTSVNNLKQWNQLTSDLIIVGQELVVRGKELTTTAAINPAAGSEVAAPKQQKTQAQPTENKTSSNVTEPAPKESVETNVGPASPTEKAETNTAPQEEVKTTNEASAAPQEEAVTIAGTGADEDNNSQEPAGKTLTVTATAYTIESAGGSGVTATGYNLNQNPNAKIIAVDPSVIPLGSKVYVEGYGYATAADTGGAIKGNKIDVYVPTYNEAMNWGNRTVNVTIVE